VPPAAALIAERFAEWGEVPHIVRDVFEDLAPAAMATALDGFCERSLGAGIECGEFFEASVGSVHGLRLRDGRRVVVKLHGAQSSPGFLAAVQAVQHQLFVSGFLAPNRSSPRPCSADDTRSPKHCSNAAIRPTPTSRRSGGRWPGVSRSFVARCRPLDD
jgi:hypothetical protein